MTLHVAQLAKRTITTGTSVADLPTRSPNFTQLHCSVLPVIGSASFMRFECGYLYSSCTSVSDTVRHLVTSTVDVNTVGGNKQLEPTRALLARIKWTL